MKTLSFIGLFYCALAWGSTFFMTKNLVAVMDPYGLSAYRFIISAIVMFPFVLRKRLFLKNLKEGIPLALFLSAHYLFQIVGIQYTSAVNAGFITGLTLLFLFIFLGFTGHKLSSVQWFACALALAGLWILTGGIQGFNKGDLITLFSAPAGGLYLFYTDKYRKKDINLTALIFHQFWVVGAVSLICCVLTGGNFAVPDMPSAMSILYLALIPTFSAIFIQIWAQKRVEPAKSGLIISLEPVFGAGFSWTLGGELFKMSSFIGGMMMFGAVFINELKGLLKK